MREAGLTSTAYGIKCFRYKQDIKYRKHLLSTYNIIDMTFFFFFIRDTNERLKGEMKNNFFVAKEKRMRQIVDTS